MPTREFTRACWSLVLGHWSFLFANLSVSVDHVFVTCQFFKPAGTAGVEFVGADTDFGAEAELATIVESRARVDHDGGAVDAGGELAGGLIVLRNNRAA